MRVSHTLLGGHVDGRPDYLPLAGEPRINSKLSLAAVEIDKETELHARIMEEGKFSLNLFSGKILNCLGLVNSLSDNNKCCDSRCVSFHGTLDNVPMLEAAPLALECRVYEVVDLGKSSFVMTEIAGRWTKGDCFNNVCRPSAIETSTIPLSDIKGQGRIVSVI